MMKQKTPLVSVILPTHDRAELLPRAIGSVQKQSFSDWELLVVDDGSTDATQDLLHRYTLLDERIRLIPMTHSGPSACRNVGLRSAVGTYLCCLDSDDEYLPEHISLRIRCMQDNPDVGFLHGGVIVTGPPERLFVPDARDRSRMIAITDCIIGGTFFGLREVFLTAGGWRDVYSEDSDLYERIAARCVTMQVFWPTYVYHRELPASRCDGFGIE